MRFLVFNLVVAAALIYLFAADRQELRAAADQSHGLAQDVKSKVQSFTGAAPAAAPRHDETGTGLTPQSVKGGRTPSLPEIEEQLAGLKVLMEEVGPTAEPPLPARPDVAATQQGTAHDGVLTADSAPQADAAGSEFRDSLVEAVEPEVAARRELVLDPEPTKPPTAKPNAQRRQELLQLIEDMELFAVEALAR